MARASKWTVSDRAKMLRMMRAGATEQDIRAGFENMNAAQFASQLKQAFVEAGELKQSEGAPAIYKRTYKATSKGRLTIPDFLDATGDEVGKEYTLEKGRGKSGGWRLVPIGN